MELGDLGGGVGVLLRDGDSPAAETSTNNKNNKNNGETRSFFVNRNRWEREIYPRVCSQRCSKGTVGSGRVSDVDWSKRAG